jgi:hypothetical protein
LSADAAGGWRGFHRIEGSAANCREIRRGFGLIPSAGCRSGNATRAALPHLDGAQRVGKPQAFSHPGPFSEGVGLAL